MELQVVHQQCKWHRHTRARKDEPYSSTRNTSLSSLVLPSVKNTLHSLSFASGSIPSQAWNASSMRAMRVVHLCKESQSVNVQPESLFQQTPPKAQQSRNAPMDSSAQQQKSHALSQRRDVCSQWTAASFSIAWQVAAGIARHKAVILINSTQSQLHMCVTVHASVHTCQCTHITAHTS